MHPGSGQAYGVLLQATVLSLSCIKQIPQSLLGTLPRLLQVTSSWLAPDYLSLRPHCTLRQQHTSCVQIPERISQPFVGVVNFVSGMFGNAMVCIIFVLGLERRGHMLIEERGFGK